MEVSAKSLTTLVITAVITIIIIITVLKISETVKQTTCTATDTLIGSTCVFCPATYSINVSGGNCYNTLGPADTNTWEIKNITAAVNLQLTHFPIKLNSMHIVNASGSNFTANISSVNYALGTVNESVTLVNANVSYNYNTSTAYQTTAWSLDQSAEWNATNTLQGDSGMGLLVGFWPIFILLAMIGLLLAVFTVRKWF